jgi:hypothetical protein
MLDVAQGALVLHTALGNLVCAEKGKRTRHGRVREEGVVIS